MTHSTDLFTNAPAMIALMDRVNAIRENKKRFSDIEDKAGNQYVDLVQEGGGVLGIALVGYTFVMERAGIRFLRLAGTSAGAINTMLLASLDKVDQPKSEKILAVMMGKDFFDFVDGSRPVRKIISKAVQGKSYGWRIFFHAIRLYQTMTHKMGLNPGVNFKDWMQKITHAHGISSMGDLQKLRMNLPEFVNKVNPSDLDGLDAKLAIISSDITTHTKAEFPKMSKLYWANPDEVKISEVVRASMSIPFFFEPHLVKNIPNAGKEADPGWDEFAKYFGPVPPSVRFVDGGMLSNFPINVFHRPDAGVPRMPTFGARLSVYREDFSKADTLLGTVGAMVSTMRQIYDYDFLMKNPDYVNLICRIDADKKYNWLEFDMPVEKQIELFVLGATRGVQFLESFDWQKYKATRSALSAVPKS